MTGGSLPLIRDDGDPAGSLKLLRNVIAQQGRRIGMPAHGLDGIGLRQALQEPNAFAAGVQIIKVVENEQPVLVPPEVTVVLPLKVTELDPLLPFQ